MVVLLCTKKRQATTPCLISPVFRNSNSLPAGPGGTTQFCEVFLSANEIISGMVVQALLKQTEVTIGGRQLTDIGQINMGRLMGMDPHEFEDFHEVAMNM